MKDSTKKNTEIVCTGCGARYSSLPGITCPRCRTPLCRSGCENCTACGLRLPGKGRGKDK